MGVVMSMASEAFAQADPYDPSSPNYVGNKAKVKRPRFNASISASAFRSFDEFAEEGAYYEGIVGMYINDNLRSDVTVGYSHPFDLDAERTDRWELEDITLRLLRPSYWKSDSKSQNLAFIGSLTLPTSGTSQDASLYSRLRFTAQYTYRVGRYTFAATPSITAALHEFETADEDGFLRNNPLGVTAGGSVRYAISSKLGVLAAVSIASLFDYDFQNRNVQSISGAVQYALNKKVFLQLSGRWRDRVITNNSLFDDDASQVALTMVYSL
jgi:hypothetical protein